MSTWDVAAEVRGTDRRFVAGTPMTRRGVCAKRPSRRCRAASGTALPRARIALPRAGMRFRQNHRPQRGKVAARTAHCPAKAGSRADPAHLRRQGSGQAHSRPTSRVAVRCDQELTVLVVTPNCMSLTGHKRTALPRARIALPRAGMQFRQNHRPQRGKVAADSALPRQGELARRPSSPSQGKRVGQAASRCSTERTERTP